MHGDQKTFFITGADSGLGAAFARTALAAGHRVAGTFLSASAAAAFNASGRALGIQIDLTQLDDIPAAVAAAEAALAPIDVLINNAARGHEGTIEESTIAELRAHLEINVIALAAVIKAVVPGMRARRRGHIVNITSMGGLVGYPALGYYAASKFAAEGLTESLAKEMAPFGVHVTAVAPGSFRTDWAKQSVHRAERTVEEYEAVFEPLRQARAKRSGAHTGDPDKAGQAILRLIASDKPPQHLLLGPDSMAAVQGKVDALAADMAAWKETSLGTNVD